DGVGREDELVGLRVVRENAAAEVYRRVPVVVELDKVDLRQIGVGQEFIDEDRAVGVCGKALRGARCATDGVAGLPGARVTLAIARPRQHQRMTGAVRRRREGRFAAVSPL